jgi:hypothetical protein
MIRVTASLECDGCGTLYDVPVNVPLRKVERLKRWIGRVRKEACHVTNPARERWAAELYGISGRGDYCPRCQAIAARQSLEVEP